ncbi:MAG: hypothetical protein GY737_07505 [Desulfobacteraceae bacterium]|nr:hypothetical protein [Desulfobacteraceae bacterium]
MKKLTSMVGIRFVVAAVIIAGTLAAGYYFIRDDKPAEQESIAEKARATEPETSPAPLPPPDVTMEQPENEVSPSVPQKVEPTVEISTAKPTEENFLNDVEPVETDYTDEPMEIDYTVDYDVEVEYQQNKEFEAEALETFPVHTVQTHNPKDPKAYGPPKGEVWIRIKPENAREMNEIMAQVADLYRETAAEYGEEITIMHWVGARPYARTSYAPDGQIN